MVPIKALLPDFKNLVTELDEDLLARAQQDDKIDTGLREAFRQVEKGGRTAQAFEVWREDYLDQVAVAWVLTISMSCGLIPARLSAACMHSMCR